MNALKCSNRPAMASYGAALLFAIHLVTYFIPPIRDVTTSSSVIGAEALALLALVWYGRIPRIIGGLLLVAYLAYLVAIVLS